MPIRWSTKSVAALGIVSVLAGWQLSPMFAKDPVTDANVKAFDSDWGSCLRAHIQKRLFKTIDATPEQQDKLSSIFSDTMEQNRGLRSQVKDKLLAIIDAFSDQSTSNEQLKQQVSELKEMHDKLMESRFEGLLKARAILTSEQKKTLGHKIKVRAEVWLDR